MVLKKCKQKSLLKTTVMEGAVVLSNSDIIKDSSKNPFEGLPVFVTKEAPRKYRAKFGFRVLGANRVVDREQNENGETKSENWLGRLVKGMNESDKIDFIYFLDKDKSLGILILGSCVSTKASDVKEKARKFLLECRTLLSMQNECVFESLFEIPILSSKEVNVGLEKTISVRGIKLRTNSKHAVGFEEDSNSSVSSDPYVVELPLKNYDSNLFGGEFLKLIMSSFGDLKLTVTVSKRLLTDLELDAMETITSGLERGSLSPVLNNGTGRLVTDNREAICKWASSELHRWLSCGAGYELTCRLESSELIPEALLETISLWLFGSEPVGKDNIKVADDNGSSILKIDLTNHFSVCGQAPPLLPSAVQLLSYGFPSCQPKAQENCSKEGSPIGYTHNMFHKQLVKLDPEVRDRHTYIIGATGTGKTTLLLNMIQRDLQSGSGVILLDPHGDLYQKTLQNIPSNRSKDVILIDPTDVDYVVGLNLLEGAHKADSLSINMVINNLLETMDKTYNLYSNGLAGPIWETYMRNAMLLLLECDHPNPTLLDIVKIFENHKFRSYCKGTCRNHAVVSFFNEVAERAIGESSMSNMAVYVTSKLNRFTQNALLRTLVGQPVSGVNFRKEIDKGSIILVNLAKGKLGAMDSQMLGFIVLSKIINSVMSRCDQDVQCRKPTYLYIDEFQNLTSTDLLAQMLSECRKFGLSLILAHQHLGQLSSSNKGRDTLEALLGNVGSSIFFRLGANDSELLKTYTLPEFTPSDLQGLSDFTAVARLSNQHRPLRPQLLYTLPGGCIENAASSAEVIKQARQYTRTRTIVEKELQEINASVPVKVSTGQNVA